MLTPRVLHVVASSLELQLTLMPVRENTSVFFWKLGSMFVARRTSIGDMTTFASPALGPVTFTENVVASGTLRGRIGYAPGNVLFYATGGLAWSYDQQTLTLADGTAQWPFLWRLGWTAGLGLEYAITDNWSARLEYRHVDLGDSTQAYSIANVPFSLKYKNQFDIGTVGVNYRF